MAVFSPLDTNIMPGLQYSSAASPLPSFPQGGAKAALASWSKQPAEQIDATPTTTAPGIHAYCGDHSCALMHCRSAVALVYEQLGVFSCWLALMRTGAIKRLSAVVIMSRCKLASKEALPLLRGNIEYTKRKVTPTCTYSAESVQSLTCDMCCRWCQAFPVTWPLSGADS